MYIINKSLDNAMKAKGRATYSDFWRLNPYQSDFIAWRVLDDVYIETTYCDCEKIIALTKKFLETEKKKEAGA